MSNREAREGPTIVTVSHESCLGCKWHEMIMWKSGRNPVYHHYCNHPDSKWEHKSFVDPRSSWIGESNHTPAWCPVKQAAQGGGAAEHGEHS